MSVCGRMCRWRRAPVCPRCHCAQWETYGHCQCRTQSAVGVLGSGKVQQTGAFCGCRFLLVVASVRRSVSQVSLLIRRVIAPLCRLNCHWAWTTPNTYPLILVQNASLCWAINDNCRFGWSNPSLINIPLPKRTPLHHCGYDTTTRSHPTMCLSAITP